MNHMGIRGLYRGTVRSPWNWLGCAAAALVLVACDGQVTVFDEDDTGTSVADDSDSGISDIFGDGCPVTFTHQAFGSPTEVRLVALQ